MKSTWLFSCLSHLRHIPLRAAPPKEESGQGSHLRGTSQGSIPEGFARLPLLESGRHAVRNVSFRGLLLPVEDGARVVAHFGVVAFLPLFRAAPFREALGVRLDDELCRARVCSSQARPVMAVRRVPHHVSRTDDVLNTNACEALR